MAYRAAPGAIDALVQEALVELFDAYGVALGPTPRAELRNSLKFHEVTATIGFSRNPQDQKASHSGRLTLSMPSAVFALVKDEAARCAGRDDWARELTNQLMGRIKNRLLHFGASLQIGLPAIYSSSEHRPDESRTLRLYTGATPGGEVLVTLEGMPEESELSWVGSEGLVLEGDAILL